MSGSDESGANILGYLVALATATDSSLDATRGLSAIPVGILSDVSLVTDASVCTAAGSAYAAAERDSTLTGGRAAQPGDTALGQAV